MTAPSITLIGNLTADPELRFTPSGKAVANFTIVTSKSVKDEKGNWKDEQTVFWRCVVWGTTAENVAESLQKGDSVIAQGNPEQKSYERKIDGAAEPVKVTYMELTVWNLGPDLKRWSVKVDRVKRTAQEAPVDDPWANAGDEPPF